MASWSHGRSTKGGEKSKRLGFFLFVLILFDVFEHIQKDILNIMSNYML